MNPSRRIGRTRLAELRLFVRRSGIGILDAGGQRPRRQKRVAHRLGVRRVGQETDALPAHRLLLDFALFGELLFKIVNADAALDEANSKKYGDMVENLSKHSQLIVITHNRETMSRAGVLYGVTMGREGYSKLLSIAFNEALAVAK